MKPSNIDDIFEMFQVWVDEKNSNAHPKQIEYNGYMPPDEDFNIIRPGQENLPDKYIAYPVQQGEEELKQLIEFLVINLAKLDRVLEIGLGRLGGTHVLFNLLFTQVYSVEWSQDRVIEFWKNNKWPWIDQDTSVTICGDSRNEETYFKLYNELGHHSFDFLFMDASHKYSDLVNDYLNYKDLVVPGGVIAWHDTIHRDYGVFEFLFDLRTGKIDNEYHNVCDIVYSNAMGISLIVV